jgi:hypothetical protein
MRECTGCTGMKRLSTDVYLQFSGGITVRNLFTLWLAENVKDIPAQLSNLDT